LRHYEVKLLIDHSVPKSIVEELESLNYFVWSIFAQDGDKRPYLRIANNVKGSDEDRQLYRIKIYGNDTGKYGWRYVIRKYSANFDDFDIINLAQEKNAIFICSDDYFINIIRFNPKKTNGIIALQIGDDPNNVEKITQKLMSLLSAQPKKQYYKGKLLLITPDNKPQCDAAD
jgi:hypothetical protein